MAESMKTQAVKGVAWSAIERFSMQGVQFVLTIVISRLVAPSEYGLIAMLGIFMSLAQWFIDSGFSNALIQKRIGRRLIFLRCSISILWWLSWYIYCCSELPLA